MKVIVLGVAIAAASLKSSCQLWSTGWCL